MEKRGSPPLLATKVVSGERAPETTPPLPHIKSWRKKIHQWIRMEFSVWKKVKYWGCISSCLRNWSSSYINQFKGLDYDFFKPFIMQVMEWILPQSSLSSFIWVHWGSLMATAWQAVGNQANSLPDLSCVLRGYRSSPHSWTLLITLPLSPSFCKTVLWSGG